MRLRYLGGAGEIGRLGLELGIDDATAILDYGLAPESPPEVPLSAPDHDAVLLTHAHLDHSGMIPAIALRHGRPIHASRITQRVSTMLHRDTLKIARIEGYPEPFPDLGIERALDLYQDAAPGDAFTIGDRDQVEVTPHLAGHIPGAFQFHVQGRDQSLVFTGDLFTQPTRLVPAGRPVAADVVCIETTYAGREHANRYEEETRFIDAVTETVERGGTAIVPAFATGRTQEVLLSLVARTDFSIWLDGMGGRVLDVFLDEPDYLSDPAALRNAKSTIRTVRNHRQRNHAANTADVIVTTSGMLEGGPVLYYLERLRRDSRASVLLTGYQVDGTNGRRLIDHGTILDRGVEHRIDLQIERFDLSTHLGHHEIVEYVDQSGCDDVVLYHGYAREALVDDLSRYARVHLPDAGETLHLPG